jgi:hypothetical protein
MAGGIGDEVSGDPKQPCPRERLRGQVTRQPAHPPVQPVVDRGDVALIQRRERRWVVVGIDDQQGVAAVIEAVSDCGHLPSHRVGADQRIR